MREESQGRFEMLWDCPNCGTDKLLGLTHRHCPNCGAAQDPSKRYFPADDQKVAVENHPYQGAELVRRHGRPADGRHSLQIEINRALYMNEAKFERHDGFDRLAQNLGTLVAALDDGLRLSLYPQQ